VAGAIPKWAEKSVADYRANPYYGINQVFRQSEYPASGAESCRAPLLVTGKGCATAYTSAFLRNGGSGQKVPMSYRRTEPDNRPHIGRTTLMTAFKKYTGSAINDYLICCRIDIAGNLLWQDVSVQKTEERSGLGNKGGLAAILKAYWA
jgi:hypothetical protein